MIVARSASMLKVLAEAERVAPHRAPVLLIGETGSGKGVVAQHIHEQSGLKGPFVAVNVGALPAGLVESELFGHARGSFTGAVSERQGLMEQAAEGTLFLDEIGDMPIELQVKLLRAIEERSARRVGEDRERSVGFRLVSATNQDLEQRVASGQFRTDLYYRINVVSIVVPPLRERRADIAPLVEFFALRMGVPLKFTPEALRDLEHRYWRGNIRELENMVASLAIMVEGHLVRSLDLPAAPVFSRPDSELVDDALRRHVELVLDRHGHRALESARAMGINQSTLYRWRLRWGHPMRRGPGRTARSPGAGPARGE